MKQVNEKVIPATIAEIVDPNHTAFLIIDVQNDFFLKGAYGGLIERRSWDISTYKDTIKNIRKMLEMARKSEILVIYTQHTTLPNYLSESAETIRWRMKKYYELPDPKLIPLIPLEGSSGQQIVDEIKPLSGDVTVKKHRLSGFFGTDLDIILRTNNIRTIVVAGIVTQGCVLSTIIDAANHDYYAVVLKDCVDSPQKDLHNAALKIMSYRYYVESSSKIMRIWSATV